MFFKRKIIIVKSIDFKKFRIKIFFKIVNLFKLIESKIILYIEKHVKMLINCNSIEIYFMKNKIKNNKF